MSDGNVFRFGLYDAKAKKFMLLNSKEELKKIFILLEQNQ